MIQILFQLYDFLYVIKISKVIKFVPHDETRIEKSHRRGFR